MIAQMSIPIFKVPDAFAGAGYAERISVACSTGAETASEEVSVLVPQEEQNFAFSSSFVPQLLQNAIIKISFLCIKIKM
jgi:hypothetical protein